MDPDDGCEWTKVEYPIWGIAREGTAYDPFDWSEVPPDSIYSRDLDRKVYELKDHLASTRVVLKDWKESVGTVGQRPYEAVLGQYTNVYPFGMEQPGRSWNGDPEYRYGYNGKEHDPELSGDKVNYNYGWRQYDARVARFLSVDPLASSYPYYTPYQFAGNSPIANEDLDGLEPKPASGAQGGNEPSTGEGELPEFDAGEIVITKERRGSHAAGHLSGHGSGDGESASTGLSGAVFGVFDRSIPYEPYSGSDEWYNWVWEAPYNVVGVGVHNAFWGTLGQIQDVGYHYGNLASRSTNAFHFFELVMEDAGNELSLMGDRASYNYDQLLTNGFSFEGLDDPYVWTGIGTNTLLVGASLYGGGGGFLSGTSRGVTATEGAAVRVTTAMETETAVTAEIVINPIKLTTSSIKTAPSRTYTIMSGSNTLYKFGVTDAKLKRYHEVLDMAGPGATGKYSNVMPKYQAHIMEKYLRSLHFNSTGQYTLPGMKVPYPINFDTGKPIKP